jgi:hypothetical protein
MTSSVLPEYGLLLDVITSSGAHSADLSAWDRTLWDRTLRIAEWNRLSPMLFSYLRSSAGVPAAVHDALEQAYLANAARNLFVGAAQRRVLDALAAANVPAMLLKGAALVETVYADPALREMLDLDILVPSDLMSTATVVLASLGYHPLSESEDAEQSRQGIAAHHDPALIGDKEIFAVELHRHIARTGEASKLVIDDFWQRARSSAKGAHRLPAPEDLLLHVCLHFTRNRLGGGYQRRNTGGALAQICDIARIIDREEVDWAALARAARRYHMDASVFLALFAARQLGVAVPGLALAELRPPSFDPAIGRRLVALRVLSADDHLPVRSARWMLLPSREVLSRGWAADPAAPLSLARAYVRRARAHAPLARAALRQPWTIVQDRRLNDQLLALQEQP